MWRYQRQIQADVITLTTAKREIFLFGRKCDLSLTAYHFQDLTSITFGLRPKGNGLVGVNHRTDGIMRTIEQNISIPHMDGCYLQPSNLGDDEEVFVARTVSDALLRKTASVIETARQVIRRELGKECYDVAISSIERCFGRWTVDSLKGLLADINWPLMFDGSVGISERTLEVIDASMRNHEVEFYPIGHDEPVPIESLAHEAFRIDKARLSDLKAANLLKHVLGQEYYDEFCKSNQVTIREGGYKFVVRPGAFVTATDPNGVTAQLCIHTVAFSCVPIDEIVLSYLHIKHQLEWYLQTANIFGDSKFLVPPKTKEGKAVA